MLFKHLYTWIKYKTLPPSFLFKNRFFVERDSKHLRIMNNIGLVFRNERWTNWDAPHFDWKWIDLFILMSRYLGSFLFILFIWKFWGNFLIEVPVFNKVALRFWLIYEFFDYYSLYGVWILLLMRSFIWDTFIVVLLSGSAKHYYPLARREEATRREANQMRQVVHEIRTDLPEMYKTPKTFIWTLLTQSKNQRPLAHLFTNHLSPSTANLVELTQITFRISYLLHLSNVTNFNIDGDSSNLALNVVKPSMQFLVDTTKTQKSRKYISSYHNTSRFISSKHLDLTSLIPTKDQRDWKTDYRLVEMLKNITNASLHTAKQRRFYMFSSLNSPAAYLAEIQTGYLKSFVSGMGNWFTPERNNIWTKANRPTSIYNLAETLFPFDIKDTQSPTHHLISNRSVLSLTALFNYESPFEWLVNRAKHFDKFHSIYSFNMIESTSTTISSKQLINISNDNRVHVSNLNLFTISGLHKNNLERVTAPIFSTYRGLFPLETEWSLWTSETSIDLSELYLTSWVKPTLESIKTQSPSKTHKIIFRR